MSLFLHGIGHAHPEATITNRFLEELDIGTDNDWIVERVGIRERRTVLPLDYIRSTRNADVREGREAATLPNHVLGARALAMASQRAGVPLDQVGMVISGSSSPGVVTPAEAAFVARELEIDAPCFDLNSACSTFVAQLYHLSLMDPAKLPEYVAIVAAESLTTTVDYRDRSTAVLFGDGAAAAIVSTRVPASVSVDGIGIASDPKGAEKVLIPRTGYFAQEGRAVQVFAIRRTREGYEKIQALQAGEDARRRLHFIGHQANLRVLEQVCQRCEIEPESHHSNVETNGNSGGASAPSVLSMHWEKFTPNDDLALVVVGGGLTWARARVRFGAAEGGAS